jgi:hypothetical protein
MRRRRWLRWMGSVGLVAVLSASSCSTSSDSAEPEPACVRDRTPFSLDAGTYADAGKLGDAKGSSRPFVVVFDEMHSSRVGQVEIAIMLNRLYRRANLRHLALEGSVLEKEMPDLSWFSALPDAGIRTTVALQLLRQGEVSAAEFAAMVLPGFRLHPIERGDEYRVELPDTAWNAYTGYLVAIAMTSIETAEAEQAVALFDQGRREEALQFIIDTDDWTSTRNEILERPAALVTTEEMKQLGTELEARAQEVGADVSEYRDDLRTARTFFDTAAQRSETMAAKTAELATERVGDCAPIAMNIGAAHTPQVRDLLSQSGMSYASVSPLSLTSDSNNGSLSTEAYDRKLRGQSVDPAGTPGAVLDGRRKPPLTIDQDWFEAKTTLSYATIVLARAAAGGDDEPPFNLDQKQLGLGGSGPDSSHIAIDLSTVRVVPVDTRKEVIFKATYKKRATFWVRAGVVAPLVGEFRPDDLETLERALTQLRNELDNEPPAEEAESSAQPQVATLSPDVKAAVADNEEELKVRSLI